MGTWSVSLSGNDLYADIYYEFSTLYNEGYPVDELSHKLVTENQELIDSFDDGYIFWLALAKAQWKCKQLDPSVFAHVKKTITAGQNITVWRELGAGNADLKKRQVVLYKLLQQLETERSKIRKLTGLISLPGLFYGKR